MNIDRLRASFPDERACEKFLESVIWSEGRVCPHCGSKRSWRLNSKDIRFRYYECGWCKKQFSVTTKTPLHSTKLSLWKWILAIYFVLNSSKGISSVFLGRLIGVSQKTAWKMGHAIRLMMDQGHQTLRHIVELDEKYIGGKPRPTEGKANKRGRGTAKQCVFIAVERQGSACAQLVDTAKQQ